MKDRGKINIWNIKIKRDENKEKRKERHGKKKRKNWGEKSLQFFKTRLRKEKPYQRSSRDQSLSGAS